MQGLTQMVEMERVQTGRSFREWVEARLFHRKGHFENGPKRDGFKKEWFVSGYTRRRPSQENRVVRSRHFLVPLIFESGHML